MSSLNNRTVTSLICPCRCACVLSIQPVHNITAMFVTTIHELLLKLMTDIFSQLDSQLNTFFTTYCFYSFFFSELFGVKCCQSFNARTSSNVDFCTQQWLASDSTELDSNTVNIPCCSMKLTQVSMTTGTSWVVSGWHDTVALPICCHTHRPQQLQHLTITSSSWVGHYARDKRDRQTHTHTDRQRDSWTTHK